MTGRRYDPKQLAALVASGATNNQIAKELEASPNALRNALRRNNLRAKAAWQQTVREKVQEMPQAEAIEYLIYWLECLSSSLCGGSHETDNWSLSITPFQRKMLICLVDAEGDFRTREQLVSASQVGTIVDAPVAKVIDVQISKMRKAIPATRGRIMTVWGSGYRFSRAPCRKCGGRMAKGVATGQTFVGGTPDFPGDTHATTVSAGGPGTLIDVLKCTRCGWSVTT